MLFRSVAGAKPTPGSGSVAALVAASAAALGCKVCAVSMTTVVNRQGSMREWHARLKRLEAARRRLEQLIDADARAYAEVIASRKLSRGNPKQEGRLTRALRRAVEVPLDIAAAALQIAEELRGLAGRAKASVAPDAKIGRAHV